jgi:hypothetical protein
MVSTLLDRMRDWLARENGAPITRTIEGFRVDVLNTRPDIDTTRVYERIAGALALIRQYQPRRFRRMQRDFARILVQRYPCRGAFHPDSRTCITELTFSVNPDFSLAQIASSMVHEGIHARVRAMCHSYHPDQLPHEERLCRRAELEFGLAVPNGEPVVARALASLQLEDDEVAPSIDWEEAARRVQSVDQAARRG